MASTNFVDKTTVIEAEWLNEVDEHTHDQTTDLHDAGNIINTPAGNISATDVQTAINELDSEKQTLNDNLTDVASITQNKGDIIVSDGVDLIDVGIGSNNQVLVADSGETSGLKWGYSPGMTIQVIEATPVTATSSTTSAIPYDSTIPQNTEGVELITATITPKSTTNRLFIEGTIPIASSNAAVALIAALFQDSIANALAVSVETVAAGTHLVSLHVIYEMAAGTTSATTFKLRAGPSANTGYFNHSSDGTNFGAVAGIRLRVSEVAV